ncbi:MAG TPA: helix-turn-helix domain-containing protein [Polyangia bacterium]
MKVSPRFTGLKLAPQDRTELLKLQRSRKPQTPRRWRRIRALLLLDRGYSVRAAATAVGGYHREVSRVGKRYLHGGLVKALSDEPRPKPSPMLDSTQQAALVALVCGPPPAGRARWTVRLLAEQAGKRGVVDKVGRETVRIVLARHDLKPWREKNVVRSEDRLGVRGPNGGRA